MTQPSPGPNPIADTADASGTPDISAPDAAPAAESAAPAEPDAPQAADSQPEPGSPPGATPPPDDEPRATETDPVGRPLYRHPRAVALAAGALLLVVVLVWVTVALTGSDGEQDGPDVSQAAVGDCLHNIGTQSAPRVSLTDCTGPDADYMLLARLDGATTAEGCPSVAVMTYAHPGPEPFVLCMVEPDSIMFAP